MPTTPSLRARVLPHSIPCCSQPWAQPHAGGRIQSSLRDPLGGDFLHCHRDDRPYGSQFGSNLFHFQTASLVAERKQERKPSALPAQGRGTRMNSALMQLLSGSLPSTGKPRSSISNNLIPNNITNVTLNLEAKHLDPENRHLAKLPFIAFGFSFMPADHSSFHLLRGMRSLVGKVTLNAGQELRAEHAAGGEGSTCRRRPRGGAERSCRACGSTAESTARPEGISAFCRQPEADAGAHQQPERAEPRTQPPSVRPSPRDARPEPGGCGARSGAARHGQGVRGPSSAHGPPARRGVLQTPTRRQLSQPGPCSPARPTAPSPAAASIPAPRSPLLHTLFLCVLETPLTLRSVRITQHLHSMLLFIP